MTRKKGPLTEQEILESVQKGDRSAYGAIVERHMKAAYFTALGLLHNPQDALDISQDAFIRAFRKIRYFDSQKPFFPWFYRIMKNICIDHLRRRRRRAEVPLEDVPVVDDKMKSWEMKEVLWKAVSSLPFAQRELIVLRYFRNLSYKEIAELTGRPLGTIMSSLYSAKRQLREMLDKPIGNKKRD